MRLLEHLGAAIGHLDAGALDEPVIIFLAEGGFRHLTPSADCRLLAAHEHGFNARAGSAASRQASPHIGDEATDLRHLPDDHAVKKQVTILEDDVLLGARHGVLMVGSHIRLQVAEGVRPGKRYEILVAVLGLERTN